MSDKSSVPPTNFDTLCDAELAGAKPVAIPDTQAPTELPPPPPSDTGSGTLSLRELPGESATPAAPLPPGSSQQLGRYELLGEIGHGGMGLVLRGRDPELNRQIALKVLLDRHRGRSDAETRFLEEAQIGGQLQHPGIVPVYEMGRVEGRLFFAMKLIQGRTLSELLAERKGPADDLPSYLLIFEQMCQALAYSHARGVIHRDLKPANVMVGAFGEVQVMDWGLAKVLDDTQREAKAVEEQPHEAVQTQRSESATGESRAGSILGTPAYMPPEQARGEIDRLDERADVFGLGAILCEILTGEPPFIGSNVTNVLSQAAHGDLSAAFGRLARSEADEELKDIARACLHAERDERPRNAGVVAERVSTYRAKVQARLHQAELERTAADARAEEAQARAAAEAAARVAAEARALAERRARRLTVGLAASILLILLLGGGTAAYLRQQQLMRQAEQARREAEVTQAVTDNLRQATDSLRKANWPDAEAAVGRAEAHLEAGPAPANLRPQILSVKADLRLAARLEAIRQEQAAEAANGNFDYARAETDYRQAFAEHDLQPETAAVAALVPVMRESAIRVQMIEALDDWAIVKGRLQTAGREHLLALAGAADEDAWRKEFRNALSQNDVAMMTRLAVSPDVADQKPATLALVGYALNRAGERTLAIQVLRDAQRRHPGDFWLNQRLGLYLGDETGTDPEEAVEYFRAAVALRPDSPSVKNLGGALFRCGKFSEAAAIFRSACRLLPGDAMPLAELALTLNALQQFADAEAAAGAALRLDARLALAHHELGVALQARGKTAEAIAEYQQARTLDPKSATACLNLGFLFSQQNKPAEAEKEYREAVRREPKSAQCQRELGIFLKKQRNFSEAETAYAAAIRLQPKDAENYFAEGSLQFAQGHYPAAETAYKSALRLKPDYADAHLNLGNTLATEGKTSAAESSYRAALRFKKDSLLASYNLSRLLYLQGRFAEAVPLLRRAAELGQKPGASEMADEADRLTKIESKLVQILGPGDRSTVADELSEAVRLCLKKEMYAVATRFYEEAFAALPTLPDNPEANYRYEAARCAVRAAAGQGPKVIVLDEMTRTRLRRQAYNWLRAELALSEKNHATSAAQVAKNLRQWRDDPQLAAIRDKDALAQLPEAERMEWEKLWRDVNDLMARAPGNGK